MLHKELDGVIDDSIDAGWIVVIEGDASVFFHDSHASLKTRIETNDIDDGAIGVLLVDDSEVVVQSDSSNALKDLNDAHAYLENLLGI